MLSIQRTNVAFILLIAALLIIAWPLASSAADGSWSMPNLNPFSSKGKPPTSTRAGNPPTSGWHMPNLLPGNATAKKKPAQSSSWQKMNNSSKTFFSKTADALNPWDKKTPAPPTKITGSNTAFTHNKPAKPEAKSSSILPTSWWTSDKKDSSPKSVNEFLSQQRPQ